MEGTLTETQQMKANTKTFLRMLKDQYKTQINQNSSWKLDFNNLKQKYDKYKTNDHKIKKIYKKVSQLFADIKKVFPKA